LELPLFFVFQEAMPLVSLFNPFGVKIATE